MSRHDDAFKPNAVFSAGWKPVAAVSGPPKTALTERRYNANQPFNFRSKISPATDGFALPSLNFIT